MSTPRPSLRIPPPSTKSRLLVLSICFFSACFHLFLANGCANIGKTLGRQIEDDDEGGEWRKLEAIKLVVNVARLSSLVSVGMAVAGAVGIVKDKPTPVRLFMLNSFLSLGSELLLLALVSLLTFSSMSSSSFSSSLCEAIAHSDMGSVDVLGWSLESCEERWKGLATGMSGFITTIALIRAWASLQILSYYTSLAKRTRRRLSINTSFHRSTTGGGVEHYSDAGTSRDLPSPISGGGKRRPSTIYLLPNPVDSTIVGGGGSGGGGEGNDLPLLSLTPSSPLDSFPPRPFPLSLPSPTTEDQKFLVYAPVMMTLDQARSLNAREVTYSRPRSRSNTGTGGLPGSGSLSGTSGLPPTPTTEISSPLLPALGLEDDDATPIALSSSVGGKGKLA